MVKLTTLHGAVYIDPNEVQAVQQHEESTTIITKSNYTIPVQETAEEVWENLKKEKKEKNLL